VSIAFLILCCCVAYSAGVLTMMLSLDFPIDPNDDD
jgi:hypothetical protein